MHVQDPRPALQKAYNFRLGPRNVLGDIAKRASLIKRSVDALLTHGPELFAVAAAWAELYGKIDIVHGRRIAQQAPEEDHRLDDVGEYAIGVNVFDPLQEPFEIAFSPRVLQRCPC